MESRPGPAGSRALPCLPGRADIHKGHSTDAPPARFPFTKTSPMSSFPMTHPASCSWRRASRMSRKTRMVTAAAGTAQLLPEPGLPSCLRRFPKGCSGLRGQMHSCISARSGKPGSAVMPSISRKTPSGLCQSVPSGRRSVPTYRGFFSGMTHRTLRQSFQFICCSRSA